MLNFLTNQYPIAKRKGFLTLIRAIVIYGLAMLTTLPAYSSQSLYTLNSNQGIIQSGLGLNQSDAQVISIHFDDTSISNLTEGALIDVPIPGKKIAKGKVIDSNPALSQSQVAASPSQTRRTIVSLDNDAGSVEIVSVNNTITEMMLHDVSSDKIYSANINANGDGSLILQDNNDYYCVKYPETDPLIPVAQQDPVLAELIPSVSTLRNLQSRPGSANVLYIDYWGGSLTDSFWNANYTSNAPINYTPYSNDPNTSSFSSSERYSMWLAWREAVEDFAPFDLNITTSRAVYDAAAITNRSQMIVTTTQDWYSNNAGGVALVNIFDDNREYYKAAWTWNDTDSSMGMTISHEAGHQLGLAHDGIGSQGYYRGHGVWGPIMGAPFGKPYVQWSKGEYPDANQNEDDIVKITGKLGLIADDAENSYANATRINLPVSNRKGVVGFQDRDAYKFTLTSAGSTQIKVISLLGKENESRAANLAMDVTLAKVDTNGTVISNISAIRSSDNSPLSPLTNVFEYNNNLAAGTYVLRIKPSSPDTNLATGFNNYSNAGEYLLSVNTTTNGPVKTLGKPSLNRSTDVGLFIWEASKDRWVINVLSAGQPRVVDVDVLSQNPLSNVVPVSIESNDVFSQIPNGLDMRLNVNAPWMDGAKFTIQNQSSTCVSTSNADVPIYLGPDKVLMPDAFDLSTLQPCNVPTIKTVGKPPLDRSTDVGIFLWENSKNKWVMNVLSGDRPRTVEVDVVSQQSLSNVSKVSIESSDVFTQLANSLDMSLKVNAPWMDGVKFTVKNQSGTCVSTTNADVPIYIGPDRVNVSGNFNLNTLTSCQ